MHDSNPDDTDDEQNRTGLGVKLELGLRTLVDLLSQLDESDRIERSDRRERGRASIGSGFSARTGPGPAGRGRASGPRKRTTRRVASDDYHVETRREDGDLLLIADLAGVSLDDVSVGIAERTNDLVLAVEGTPVERVPLEWDDAVVANAAFNNGVLEVRLRPGDGT